jgi:AraC-like DNA-binding protein
MLLLQAFPTIGVTIVSLIVGVLLARALIAGHREKPRLLLFALMISVGFGYLWLLPSPLALPSFWSNVARALSIPSVGLCWWFACSLLDDRFRMGLLQWLGLMAVCIFPTYYFLHSLGATVQQWPRYVLDFGIVPPLALCAHMLWMAIAGFRDDLLEGRRRFRLWIVAVIAVAILASLLSEEVENLEAGNILRASFAFCAALLILFWLVRFSHEALAFESTIVDERKEPIEQAIDPRDRVALSRLNIAMETDRAFLDPDLSLGSLAKRVGVPEHQLRALINRGLGHRNFSSYVTGLRIAYAKVALADPEKARQQILRISMDSGFASLATFNRVFKALEGVTPTDYRKSALENVQTPPQN